MKVISIKIDSMLEQELNEFLKKANVSKSSFIRTCIIEKLVRIQNIEERKGE